MLAQSHKKTVSMGTRYTKLHPVSITLARGLRGEFVVY
jgi:hypothetical protein